jgi:NAD-dependent DNA ligase
MIGIFNLIMAHRYLYHVKGTPAISDYDYDRMEWSYEHKNGELPPGSNLESSYTEEQKEIAKFLKPK